MQSIILDHSDDFYHNLLNSFLESARVNPNSFFELRIQNGSLRHKFTTTDRPDPAGYRNNVSQNRMAYFRNTPAPQPLNPKTSFYNISASKQHSEPPPAQRNQDVINQSQRRPPASKRRYIAIVSPPPTTPQNTGSPSKTADTEIVNTPPTNSLPLESSPEKLREPDHTQGPFNESDDEQTFENTVTSPFYSPNRFACLAKAAEQISKSLSPAEKCETILREVLTPPASGNRAWSNNHRKKVSKM